MSHLTHRIVPALLALLASGLVLAQDGSGGSRPPEGSSPEERRAFYQKRAAERARAEESAAPAGAAQAGGKPDAAQSGSGRPDAAQIAEWRAKRAAQKDKAAPPAANAGHRHGTATEKVAAGAPPTVAGKPEDGSRSGGRPGGMGMRGGGTIWISDMPPMRGDAVRPEGSRRGGMGGMDMGGMDMGGGPRVKRLWLRSGTDPQKAPFYREEADAAPETVLIAPLGKPEGEPLPPPAAGQRNLAFEMPAQGFYRVYATTRKLQGEILSISVAKAEVGNFTHDAEEEERARGAAADRVLDSAPIEIVRERQPNEKPLFFRLRSGDEQVFVVLQKGLPAAGARVRFVSHQGWTKEAVSDEQGRVSFQIIRDYFPPWSEFQKRFKASFLLIAEASAAEAGSYKGQPYTGVRYQATLAGSYYPSPEDYRSYAWGLGVGLAIVLFGGAAVYLYRRRRIRPFPEVRFDDAK